MPPRITAVTAREVLDCRGLPTVQADVWLEGGVLGRADVPAGRSVGRHEARELRDGGRRFGGYGVRGAVGNVCGEIADALVGKPVAPQRSLDAALIELDGTPEKSRLGANALLGVSLAAARAAAAAAGAPLHRHLNADAHVLPVPQVNLINGGRHAAGDLEFQEFIVMPVGAPSFAAAMEIATEVNLVLGDLLVQRYGRSAVNLGDEGGYVPPIADPREALEVIHEAVDRAGYSPQVEYGLDCAATHFFDPSKDTYRVGGKEHTRDDLIGLYGELVRDLGVVSIEDPLHEDDFEGFALLTAELDVQIIGDDLFTTSTTRLRRGIDLGAANALLWKVNQIGTLSEALEAASMATRNGYALVVSERSGETEDPIIADLVVALNAGQIKTGAPVRGERTAKYNRLLQVAEELGTAATYAGRSYRRPV